jgi:hypothetical protein
LLVPFRSNRAANCVTFEIRFRCVSTTPFGSPELPLVNSNAASASPPDDGSFSSEHNAGTGSNRSSSSHFRIPIFIRGSNRSTKIMSRVDGHGKVCTFLTI